MDALELLSGDATSVADTSAWWRAVALPDGLAELMQAAILGDRMLTTPIVRMEILYSARSSSEYVALEAELDALQALGTIARSPTPRSMPYANWRPDATATTVCRLRMP